MKMKKFFSNRTKKKKSSTNLDSKEPSEIPDPPVDQSIEVRKRSNQRKKGKKNRYAPNEEKQNNGSSNQTNLNNGLNTAVASNGVVLRRPSRSVNSDENSHLRSPNKTSKNSNDDPRLPGSESSSRTASSASSSSHSRWSSRRPWSLVESFGGQALQEFSESRDVILPPSADHHNTTAPPAICTLPRGTDPSALFQPNGDRRPRTLAMDFSIFRFFRRSTMSRSPDGDAGSESSAASSTRGSFRLKDLKGRKGKKNKKKSDSGKSSIRSQRSTSSNDSDQQEKKKRNRSNSSMVQEDEASASTLRAFEVCDRIDEEEATPRHEPASRMQSGSTSTHDSCSLISSTLSESLMSECSHCHRMRSSISEGHRRSSDVQISIVDTDPPLPPITTIIRTRASSSRDRPYSTPTSVASSAYTSASTYGGTGSHEFYDDSTTNSTSDASTIGASALFGGSLSAIDQRTMRGSVSAQTLPRRLDRHQPERQGLRKSAIASTIYASLPQLFAPVGIVTQNRDSSISTSSTKSSVRFSDPDQTHTDNASRPRSSVILSGDPKTDPALVDSPIKRAIGYPGVVLRRHHNRRTKKLDTKSASADLLTSDRRKQVMSLNMEDLPTYGEMRGEDLRWRSTSLFSKPGTKHSYIPGSEFEARARFREALFYQRYSSHCTSVDDVRGAHFAAHQTYKDMYNLDDDEFLDMYLASSESVPSSAETNKSNQNQEPSSKRVKTLRKSVASFANLISPGKPGSKKVQRSSSFKESTTPAFKPYRPPGSAPSNGEQSSGQTPGKRNNSANKNRRSRLWCETFDHAGLNEQELKRQEAIFELYQGECDTVQDLRLAKQTYRDSMVTLKMLTEEEVGRIFGKLDCLLPLHEDLLARLEGGRSEDGRSEEIGHVFIDWFPTLSPYEEYCANQSDAKETLDAVISREDRVRDFLQRCLASPFSRKLDLWSYLDLPRSRLVKYPLLLKNILKSTPIDHPDHERLEKALVIINDIIARVDDLTGERQSRFFQSKLEYLDEKQRCSFVEESRFLLCSGQLKTNRGTKLHVFLFDLALVLTRNATRGGKLTYQVYRQPIPLKSLTIDSEEGGKLSGSFRGGILSSDKAKHSFRVRSEEHNSSYTLIATDEHDRKQWINSLLDAVAKCQGDKRASTGSESSTSRRNHSSKSNKSSEGSVKRSSSTKGDEHGWRGRSMTANAVSRTSSKEKVDQQKKFRLESPLSRRRSNTMIYQEPEGGPATEVPPIAEVQYRTKVTTRKNSPCRRSRSLTSSPITLLANFPRRASKTGSALARSESCTTKPPTGRNTSMFNSARSASIESQPRHHNSLHPTRSTPDLSSSSSSIASRILGKETIVESNTLERVRERLEASVQEEEVSPPEPVGLTFAMDAKRHHLIPSLFIDSPEHPAASDTSRNFPIVEEESVSPLFKSITAPSPTRLSSTPSFSSFTCLPLIQPSITWAHEKPTSSKTAVTTISNADAKCEPAKDDVIVANLVSDLIERVCKNDAEVASQVNGDFVTIAGDDGLPWRGNDFEESV